MSDINLPSTIDSWDPLEYKSDDPGMLVAIHRREIRNILKSYTGYYDLFSELIQNSLDAVERRAREKSDARYIPSIWIHINLKDSIVRVTDNGCAMNLQQFKSFLGPHLSFKDGVSSRGNKGVGATYLAYGFNYLEASTRLDGKTLSGVIKGGREWVEDQTESVVRPRVEWSNSSDPIFQSVDRGTSMVIRLVGDGIRPKNLAWVGAANAEQWLSILRVVSPLGGIYLCGGESPKMYVEVEVIDHDGTVSNAVLDSPQYLYPHLVIKNTADLRDILKWQQMRIERGQDPTQLPARFRKLNGLWGEWTAKDILTPNLSPITTRLEVAEIELIEELGIQLYIFLAFSTDLWDHLNDVQLRLRKGHRILHGGLQLATRNMPQGMTITIPMTNNIGFQNLAHVIVHFENAEPDLGRKGFQPEIVRIAEKLSVSAVTAFRRRYHMLRKPGGAKIFDDELKINDWIKSQENHEQEYPLLIAGRGLFRPTYELPIRSEPMVEQDVVALFNQMLSSGVIRGIQLISSSQYKQYDGLFRVMMQPPWDDFIASEENPLGIDEELVVGKEYLKTPVKILEYKYSLDGLVEEFQSEVKSPEHVALAVAWNIGEKWSELFDVTSYLDPDHSHHRQIHGTTHSFTYSMTGAHAFEAVILNDLIQYLRDSNSEGKRQSALYSDRFD